MNRRTKAELYLNVLKLLAKEPLIITHLITKSNTNYKTIMSICECLQDHGFIEKLEVSRSGLNRIRDKKVKHRYHITMLGREQLRGGSKLCWTLGLGFNLMASTKGKEGR